MIAVPNRSGIFILSISSITRVIMKLKSRVKITIHRVSLLPFNNTYDEGNNDKIKKNRITDKSRILSYFFIFNVKNWVERSGVIMNEYTAAPPLQPYEAIALTFTKGLKLFLSTIGDKKPVKNLNKSNRFIVFNKLKLRFNLEEPSIVVIVGIKTKLPSPSPNK